MDIDLSQFYQTFFEESIESMADVEQTLVHFDLSAPSDDAINRIFRCMHSLKGGSASFGFTDISEFTHTAETYLDLVRKHTTQLTQESVNLLLASIDLIRSMIAVYQGDTSQDTSRASELRQGFQVLIDKTQGGTNEPVAEHKAETPQVTPVATEPSSSNTLPEEKGWHIYFKPHAAMLQKGNEPMRMISELKKFGSLRVHIDKSQLPVWDSFNPENCYLAWNIYVVTNASAQEIKQNIFDWVLDECDLVLTPLGAGVAETEISSAKLTAPPVRTESPVVKEPAAKVEVSTAAVQQPNVTASEGNAIAQPEELKQPAQIQKVAPAKDGASIRVGIEKVDGIINLVGELVITQAILQQVVRKNGNAEYFEGLQECLSQFEQNIRELQENVMRIRMLAISNVFNRFPRMIRDISQTMGKKVELKITGENTELDKTVLEKLGDPLVHLVRNSLDHGIEKPEVRLERGKPEAGLLHLNAYHQGSNIVIEITDDGNGLNKEKIIAKAKANGMITDEQAMTDEEIFGLIFLPGFSTADQVTDISGRGVGMDVVLKNIQQVGGRIDVQSVSGQGSTFSIRLPLTLSIIDGQILKVAEQIFIFPLISIVEIIQIKKAQVSKVGGQTEVYFLRDKYIPVIRMTEVFEAGESRDNLEGLFLVIVEVNHRQYGIVIDDLLAQQQIVIKNIENNYKHIDGIAGATVLGDGTVALIVDVSGLLRAASAKRLLQAHA